MTVPNTLADIRQKVRNLTARTSQTQLTDAQIDNYVNTFYLYDMPEMMRILKLKDTFTFTTNPLQEVYPFDNTNYVTVEPPCYVAGQQMQYFQDLDLFYREWPKVNYIQQVAVGTNSPGPYTGQLTAFPLLASVNSSNFNNTAVSAVGQVIQFMITANTSPTTSLSVIDDGFGNLLDTVNRTPAGTINYATGVFSVTFTAPIPASTQINAEYIPFVASMPRTMCLYQNQFFLRPVPDKSYVVSINAFRYPTVLASSIAVPELAQWWQYLAFGAARKVLEDNSDFEALTLLQPLYEEQFLRVQRRTIKQMANQRSSTLYSDQGMYPYSNSYPYI